MTFIVRGNVPICVDVPERIPLEPRVIPAGSGPEARVHVYGVNPPVALKAKEKADPTGVIGNAGVAIVSGADVGGVIVTFACADLLGDATLVAVTVAQVCTYTDGAVNSPVLETVPTVVVHVTAGLVEFSVIPVNC